MNKERFHNALALNLGDDRIVNDRQISIMIDDTTPDPVVTLISEASHKCFSFNVSEDVNMVYTKLQKTMGAVVEGQDLKEIIEAVHQAYVEANSQIF